MMTMNTLRLLPRLPPIVPCAHISSKSRFGGKYQYYPDRELQPPSKYDNVNMPDRYRLPVTNKVPFIWQQGTQIKPPKQTRELWRMKGEEKVHNDLTLGQSGIVALQGGMLKHKHFEVMRFGLGRFLEQGKTFAMYRVDAPYKPITNHGQGKRMGGGKGSIDHYGTPVRAGRVIVEIGGKQSWEEISPWLRDVARKLPFDAIAVNAESLNDIRQEEQRLVETNENPVSFEWLVRNNMLDCRRQVSKYDKLWFGKFVYKDRQLNKKWNWILGNRYKGKY